MQTKIEALERVLATVEAIQTVVAIYSTPGELVDRDAEHKILVDLLDDPVMIAAIQALKGDHKIVMLLGEPGANTSVLSETV